MYFRETSLAAALAVMPALATAIKGSSVKVYFGQNGNANISDVCAGSALEYITLGFIDVSPENSAAGYPGSNFAGHCWAGNYEHNGIVSDLLDDCPYLNPGIDLCQSQDGKKILLSIGGVFAATSNYSVSTRENGVAFADFIWGAFGPYDDSTLEGQPRPFDYNGVHVAVDGYDFDIESAQATTTSLTTVSSSTFTSTLPAFTSTPSQSSVASSPSLGPGGLASSSTSPGASSTTLSSSGHGSVPSSGSAHTTETSVAPSSAQLSTSAHRSSSIATRASHASHASSTNAAHADLPTSTVGDVSRTSSLSTEATGPTSNSAGQITETIWTTTVHTITSCAPTVTDCPAGTHYSTTSFLFLTTIRPGTITSPGSVSTKIAAQSETATSSSVEQWTTSTIFSTTVYTITSCAPLVTDCPARLGSVTTEIIAVTTTVCPVTAAEASSTGASSPVDTGTTGSGSTGSSGHSGSDSSSSEFSGNKSSGPDSESGDKGCEASSPSTSTSFSSPEQIATSSPLTTSGTLTVTTRVLSTLTVPVPTSSAKASASPSEVANNAGAGAGRAAVSGLAHYNGTGAATGTHSLVPVGPTVVAVNEDVVPSKSASATSPIVTAGARRTVDSVGLVVMTGAVALII